MTISVYLLPAVSFVVLFQRAWVATLARLLAYGLGAVLGNVIASGGRRPR